MFNLSTVFISILLSLINLDQTNLSFVALSTAYAITPNLKSSGKQSIILYGLVGLDLFYKDWLTIVMLRIIKHIAIINYIYPHNFYGMWYTLGMLCITFLTLQWHYKHVLILYLITTGFGFWVASMAQSGNAFYITLFLYQFFVFR